MNYKLLLVVAMLVIVGASLATAFSCRHMSDGEMCSSCCTNKGESGGYVYWEQEEDGEEGYKCTCY